MDELLRYNDLYEFLTFHTYPPGLTKNQKRVICWKAQSGNFCVKHGLLLYCTEVEQ